MKGRVASIPCKIFNVALMWQEPSEYVPTCSSFKTVSLLPSIRVTALMLMSEEMAMEEVHNCWYGQLRLVFSSQRRRSVHMRGSSCPVV